jgi:glc operon protein GlcG
MAEKLVANHSSLTLGDADQIINEALKLRLKHDLLPLAVAVLDSGGHVVSFKREDGCGILRYDIAIGKAWASLGMGMPTRHIRDRLADRPTFQAALSAASGGRFIPTPGGVLIVNQDGVAIGAVGISGDASDKDEYCAIEAIKSVGFIAEPPMPAKNWNDGRL